MTARPAKTDGALLEERSRVPVVRESLSIRGWIRSDREGVQTPTRRRSEDTNMRVRTWLSPRAPAPVERLAYAVVGTILLLVALAGFALVLLSWSMGDLGFGLFGLVMGLLTLVLGCRMLVAAATGRRLYWWPGQREDDEGGAP